MTGRNKACWPPGTGVSLRLGRVGLWDLTALLTQQCRISTVIMLVYSAALVFPHLPGSRRIRDVALRRGFPYVWFAGCRQLCEVPAQPAVDPTVLLLCFSGGAESLRVGLAKHSNRGHKHSKSRNDPDKLGGFSAIERGFSQRNETCCPLGLIKCAHIKFENVVVR